MVSTIASLLEQQAVYNVSEEVVPKTSPTPKVRNFGYCGVKEGYKFKDS